MFKQNYQSGSQLVIMDCVNGYDGHKWEFAGDSAIKSIQNTKYCLNQDDLSSIVSISTCDGSSNQLWTYINVSNED